MKKRTFLKLVVSRYFIQSKVNRVHDAIGFMKGLPDWKKKARHQKKVARIRMTIDLMNFHKRKGVSNVF